MAVRDDDDLMSDYCPKCGQYSGGDSICHNCGAKLFDDTGLQEQEEDSEDGGFVEREEEKEEEKDEVERDEEEEE